MLAMNTSLNKIIIFINIIACVALISIAAKLILIPTIAKSYYSNEYKNLVFECDNAMREHMIAKNRVIFEKTEKSVNLLKSAELGLTSCHDYDLLRKKLGSYGLNDQELGSIGLEAIEQKSNDVRDFVKNHEFRY